ncbi:hypothetical protein BGZ65_006661 [Modicella reniformis]|uniref:Uncharacterized protein n=1 Tax=Modicella reniformis TaxID=1440133 RepID=A0A9P6MMK3_9FUNG|nr:hypothetical protein BGZ65_006661 [Modicella reniformis]
MVSTGTAIVVGAQFKQLGVEPFSAVLSGSLSNPAGTIERTSVKKERGVGCTAQWRKRLITQIEDRIKDKRHSIHNARRMGLQGSDDPRDTLFDEQPQTITSGSTLDASAISEEEERRIVAEVWEAFKNENFEALTQAFHGMTDKEIEDIEQDILQYHCTWMKSTAALTTITITRSFIIISSML